MKKLSKFLSVLLAVMMLCSVFLVTACEDEGQADTSEETTISASESAGSSSGEGGSSSSEEGQGGSAFPVKAFKPEDRSRYTLENIAKTYREADVAEVVNYFVNGGEPAAVLADFRIGDVFDIAVDLLAMQAKDSTPINFDLFKFVRGEDGGWYNNYYKASVHPVLNKILNYKLDGSEKINLTAAELKTYENTTIVYMLKKSMTNAVVYENGAKVDKTNKTLNATIERLLDTMFVQMNVELLNRVVKADIPTLVDCIEGDNQAALKLFGDMTLSAIVGTEVPAPYGILTVNDLYDVYVGNSAKVVEKLGSYTFDELTFGYASKLSETFGEVTLSAFYTKIKAVKDAFMSVDEETLKEMFGEEYLIDTIEGIGGLLEAKFGGELPAQLASILAILEAKFENTTYAEVIIALAREAANIREMGYEAYVDAKIESVLNAVLVLRIGDVAEKFGFTVPETLTDRTVGEVIGKLYAVYSAIKTRDENAINSLLGEIKLVELLTMAGGMSFEEGQFGAVIEKLGNVTLADIVLKAYEAYDDAKEAGEKAYAQQLLGAAFEKISAVTLEQLVQSFGSEMPAEYADYSEITLGEIIAAIQEAATPVEDDESEQEHGFDLSKVAYIVLDSITVIQNVEINEETSEPEVVEELTALDIAHWAFDLYTAIAAAEQDKELFSLDAAYEAWRDYLYGEENESGERLGGMNDTFLYWIRIYDSMHGGVKSDAETIEEENGEGQNEIGDDETDSDERVTLEECYEQIVSYVEAFRSLVSMAKMITPKQIIEDILPVYNVNITIVPTGIEKLDAFVEKVITTTLGDIYANSKELYAEAYGEVTSITLTDVFTAAGMMDNAPAFFTAFNEKYGSYTVLTFMAMKDDEEAAAAFVADAIALVNDIKDYAADLLLKNYDFGSESVKALVRTVLTLDITSDAQTARSAIEEALSKVTMEDIVNSIQKLFVMISARNGGSEYGYTEG